MGEQLKIRQWVPTAKNYPHEFLTMLQKVQDFGYTGAESERLLSDFFLAMTVPSRNSYVVLDFRLIEDGLNSKSFGLLGGIVGRDKMTVERIAVFQYLPGSAPEIVQEGFMSTVMEENYKWSDFWKKEKDKSEQPKKYYFFNVNVYEDVWIEGKVTTSKIEQSHVSDIHPLQWVMDLNKLHGSYAKVGSEIQKRYRRKLTFYSELTEAEYLEFKDGTF